MDDSAPIPQTHQQSATFEQTVIDIVQQYMKGDAFSHRKVADMPTDSLSVVNRKFVTQNGTTTNRPTSSIIGLQFYDTTLQKPVYWSGTTWKDSQGSIV